VAVESTLAAAGLKEDGRLLSAGLFQKDRRRPAQNLSQPLLQIAIELDAAAAANHRPGEAIPLQVVRARAIPEDIGSLSSGYSVIMSYTINEVPVAVGALAFN